MGFKMLICLELNKEKIKSFHMKGNRIFFKILFFFKTPFYDKIHSKKMYTICERRFGTVCLENMHRLCTKYCTFTHSVNLYFTQFVYLNLPEIGFFGISAINFCFNKSFNFDFKL